MKLIAIGQQRISFGSTSNKFVLLVYAEFGLCIVIIDVPMHDSMQ